MSVADDVPIETRNLIDLKLLEIGVLKEPARPVGRAKLASSVSLVSTRRMSRDG